MTIYDESLQGSLIIAVVNESGEAFEGEEGQLIPINVNSRGRLQVIASAEGCHRFHLAQGGVASDDLVKDGPGVLRGLFLVSPGAGNSLDIYDGEAQAANKLIPTLSLAALIPIPPLNLEFTTGLRVVQSGGSAPVKGIVIYD